jgi:hypothetical protein
MYRYIRYLVVKYNIHMIKILINDVLMCICYTLQ